ncbi:MAG: ABC transporter permease subunit [Spirochaetes bacterium]|nr:ABC transporter permease subunit [Spirochaetota bacterium]
MNFIDYYILNFPQSWQINLGSTVDDAVREFSRTNQEELRAVRSAVIGAINGIHSVLQAVPWIVLVIAVAALGWWLSRKWYTGLAFGALLSFVGFAGLWPQMLQTLSLVITSVLLCIILGFPMGVLLAMNARVNSIIRPVLDTMQTMPSWVYLVPAVMLFSVGITPALIATTIYAIVPIIRLTSHGLVYVDKEMLEAAYAFGSTRIQTLVKVQIPQAMPTIMTGINQTIMMAVAMVVTSALIGANGLGMEILLATNRVEMGRALLPGVSIVIVAIILDRLTQYAVKRNAGAGKKNV